MQDTAIIMTYVAGTGDYGYAKSYTTGATVVCGYQAKAKEVMQDTQVVMTDVILRMPIDTVISNRDRVKVTKRFGVAITPETYEILGAPERGPSGLVLKLRKVTDGSDA